jgi:MFS family permease
MSSILVSIAILPISLSSRPAPEFSEPEHLPLKRLFEISPLGLVGAFSNGMGAASVFGMGAVYASAIGMSLPQISTFMALFIFGGIASQMPIGWASDKYDRRKVIIGVSIITTILAVICYFTSGHPYILNIVFFLLGGSLLPIYGLSMAHINDHLTPRQYVGASSSAILVNGCGAAFGPLIVSVMMSFFGDTFYFPLIALIFLSLSIYGVYRTSRRESVPLDKQSDHITMPLRPTPISISITEEGNAILKKLEDNKN